jgi:hypothetical protein
MKVGSENNIFQAVFLDYANTYFGGLQEKMNRQYTAKNDLLQY